MNWILGIVIFAFGVIIVSLFFLPSSPIWGSDVDETLFGLGLVILIFAGILWNIYGAISLGSRIRNEKRPAIPGERMPRTYMELEPIHDKILDFLEMFPANNGVTRRQIEEHLKEDGVLLAHTNLALNELMEHGYVHRTRRMRYIKP